MAQTPNDFTNERTAIEKAFLAGIVDANGNKLLPVRFENQPFTRQAGQSYGEFSIVGGNVTSAEIGGQMKRAVGVVYLRVFAPEDAGVMVFENAGLAMESTFDLKTFWLPNGTIVFERTGMLTLGKDATTGLYQKNARVNFTRDTFSNALVEQPPTPPASASNVKFDGQGNIYFFNPDVNAFQKWEARGAGNDAHLQLIP